MRLIDADALKELIDVKGANLGITNANRCNFKDMLKMTPTVDAVEVVRCGECRYYRDSLGGYTCENEFWNAEYLVPTKPDDFCSYGERKESD